MIESICITTLAPRPSCGCMFCPHWSLTNGIRWEVFLSIHWSVEMQGENINDISVKVVENKHKYPILLTEWDSLGRHWLFGAPLVPQGRWGCCCSGAIACGFERKLRRWYYVRIITGSKKKSFVQLTLRRRLDLQQSLLTRAEQRTDGWKRCCWMHMRALKGLPHILGEGAVSEVGVEW